MGLDSVELVLAVENAFGIHIDDSEASRIVTLGDFHKVITQRLTTSPSAAPCLTSAAFYRVRRAIMHALGAERRSIRPDTSLSELFPQSQRRQTWKRLQAAAGIRIPDLEHGTVSKLAFLTTGTLAVTAAGVYAGARPGTVLLLALPGFIVGGLMARAASRLADAFPQGATTVGELARQVLAQNAAALATVSGGWTEDKVWETLYIVVSAQTGIPTERLTPGSRIADDLGIC